MSTFLSARTPHSRSKVYRLGKDLLQHGVADLLRSPRKAAAYWRRIASAGIDGSQITTDAGSVPLCSVDTILPDSNSIPVSLVDYQYENGDMPAHELMILCRIVRHRRPRTIFEIATFLGGTTLQLAANSESDAVVYTLDLPPRGHPEYAPPKVSDAGLDVYPVQPGIRFKNSPYSQRIRQLFADSQTYDFRPYNGSIDLILVDGCHHYDFVRRDTENALKMRAPGGIVLWHDYGPHAPDVVKFLNELCLTVPLKRISGTSLVFHAG